MNLYTTDDEEKVTFHVIGFAIALVLTGFFATCGALFAIALFG